MRKILLLLLTMLLLTTPVQAGQSEGVRVAVIDTGISTTAISPDRIDRGINYIRPQDGTEDKLGHGTAVSAIIVGSEPARIEGICPTATLVPMVFATKDEEGKQVRGDTAMVAQAIYDAINNYHCKIINISSGSQNGSHRLQQAVEYAEEMGVLVVSCAGNNQEETPGAISYPGGYESVICVGAANSNGKIAYFSQQNNKVDLLALGTDLRLASIKGTRIRGEGTSFATAIVTGAAAQIWTKHPELTADEVRSILLESARTVDGHQVIDLEAALAWNPEAEIPAFSDVSKEAYYHDAVLWAAGQGITGGTGEGRFSPDAPCTRGQMAMFLWRVFGNPEPVTKNPFADVSEDAYYAKAVRWAYEQGITGGTGEGRFSPDDPCTRGQMAVFLLRAADGTPISETTVFADVPADAYYADAVQWAYEQKITGGTGKTTYSPNDPCTRAQMVTFLYRCFGT